MTLNPFQEVGEDGSIEQRSVEDRERSIAELTGGIDFSALWLSKLPSVEFDNESFRDAMDALGMTLEGMAAALDISKRQVADYRKAKPIPRNVAYATRYLVEAAHKNEILSEEMTA
ncbi:hypothetical protein ACU8NU_10060 [Rhizobium leguminosarum]